jgi:hypothetical protein
MTTIIKPNLIETVARALCKEDIREGTKNLTNEQYEALTYFINVLNHQRNAWNNEEGVRHWKELTYLWANENREEKPHQFVCSIDGDITDGLWKEYKRYAQVAIESYDSWLNFRKNLDV